MFFAFAFGTPQDGGPVARLLADCGLPFEDIGSHITHCILARDGAELAGCVGLEIYEEDALLRSLAVAPTHRGKGLAQRLYDRIVADARARGINRLYLLTQTAEAFFWRRGFVAAERASAPRAIAATNEFSSLCPDTAAFMVKDIGDAASHPSAAATNKPINVLFLCTGNSARSVMAEAILNATGGGRFRAWSAGSHPNGKVNPFALAQIHKAGLPTEGFRSKSWDEFTRPGAPTIDFVFTVCSDAAGEVCPVWPGHPMTAHWGVEDPAAFQGTDDEKNRFFARIYTQLHARIRILTSLPLEKLDQVTTQEKLREIGKT